ncbi:MAG: hypothetical protein ABL933_08380 [Methyloglobulus sp.]|nr:hypothetical protein [Methyloglobulus sp.]
MEPNLKNKLIEIFVEKLLIALLILLFGMEINNSLERFKLIEAQRVTDTSELVKACSEIWAKIYDYEDYLNEVDNDKRLIFLFKNTDLQKLEENNIKTKETLLEQKLQEGSTIISEKRFIIGDDLAGHFWKYLGLLKARSDALVSVYNNQNSAQINRDMLEAAEIFSKQIAAMRFTAFTAREHAINKLPH